MKGFMGFIMLGLLLISCPVATNAQNFATSHIPENLLKGANSVIRESRTVITIDAKNRVTQNKYFAVTILNKKAEDMSLMLFYHMKSDKVSIKRISVYDANGKKIKSFKQSEIIDRSAGGDAFLYSDYRLKAYIYSPSSYPYTFEYEYEIQLQRLYSLDYYKPYKSENQSIQYSSLELVNPQDIPVHISLSGNVEGLETIKTTTGNKWEFRDLPALIIEPYSTITDEILPGIFLSPQYLSYSDYSGMADSWQNYGDWLSDLMRGRNSLPNSSVEKYRKMTASASNEKEKVRILYKYLQANTHYINISLGIGGLQPSPAQDVESLGYGDCKDLSNYMMAMLDAVGIKAYYSVIQAGRKDYHFITDHPGHQFNHAIVCVPQKNDTIWLECTSQVNPFGSLGDFTDNRYALLVDGPSSKLVRTKEYRQEDNHLSSNLLISPSSPDATVSGTIRYKGIFMGSSARHSKQTLHDQQKWVTENLEFTNFTLNNHNIKVYDVQEPRVELQFEAEIRSFFSGNNDRLFVSLNLNNKISAPERMRNRKTPLVIYYPYHCQDTITVRLPSGYEPESIPESTISEPEFGFYSMKSSVENGVLTCFREFRINKGHFPPEKYQAFQAFMQQAALADSKQLVLIRK
ncbi:MAG: hypothetical protein CVT94_07215 [Bacteroidetes bacterium HGW-Bacteroidetes-11]|nr:MAG: hypothetical protein CVT94_07215 [Bacteroidetes bacterium HGW-Bacteroidetes-11]